LKSGVIVHTIAGGAAGNGHHTDPRARNSGNARTLAGATNPALRCSGYIIKYACKTPREITRDEFEPTSPHEPIHYKR